MKVNIAVFCFVQNVKILVTQLCAILCKPMDCSLPGSSVHGIFQARILGVRCHFLLLEIFQIQGLNPCQHHCRQILYHLNHHGAHSKCKKCITVQKNCSYTKLFPMEMWFWGFFSLFQPFLCLIKHDHF